MCPGRRLHYVYDSSGLMEDCRTCIHKTNVVRMHDKHVMTCPPWALKLFTKCFSTRAMELRDGHGVIVGTIIVSGHPTCSASELTGRDTTAKYGDIFPSTELKSIFEQVSQLLPVYSLLATVHWKLRTKIQEVSLVRYMVTEEMNKTFNPTSSSSRSMKVSIRSTRTHAWEAMNEHNSGTRDRDDRDHDRHDCSASPALCSASSAIVPHVRVRRASSVTIAGPTNCGTRHRPQPTA